MNRNKLQSLASEWTRLAKNDIRNKVISFMEEVGANERELAYVLAISEAELAQILEGNGEITLSTFAKLLIATGNALEIKPIEDTPIGDYENMPTMEELNRPLPPPNVFTHQMPRHMPHHGGRPIPPHVVRPMDEDEFVPPTPEEFYEAMEQRRNRQVHHPTQPRDKYGRFASTRPQTHEETSPFEAKTSDELVKIIRERLWDSEIDLNSASKADLVRFLDGKNKRMSEYKRMKALEEDPKVNEFKQKLKNTLDNNPHLREWAKKFLNNLDS